jgi:hypothetical protein
MKTLILATFAALVLSFAGTAQASRVFMSTTSTNPALINPTLNMTVGETAAIYLFWQPTTEVVGTDEYGAPIVQNEQLTGLSLDIVSSNPILSRTSSYSVLNPVNSLDGRARWGAINTGSGAATFMVDNSNAVRVGGSNLGFLTSSGQGYFNVGGTDVWRLGTLTFQATAAGTSSLRSGVGLLGITFEFTRPPSDEFPDGNTRALNFGFGDAAVSTNNFNANLGLTSTLADATVTVVPEPGTLALLVVGVIGLCSVRRLRRR